MSKQSKTAGKTAEKVAAGAAKVNECAKIVGYLVRVDVNSPTDGSTKVYRVIGRQNNNYSEHVDASKGVDAINHEEARHLPGDLFESVDEALCRAYNMSVSGHVRGGITGREEALHLPATVHGERLPQVIKVEVETSVSVSITNAAKEVAE